MMKTICIYHGNCADGFTAAWVVNKYFKQHRPFDEIRFIAGNYATILSDEFLTSFVDCEIIFVDFSYKRPVMQSIIDVAKAVLVLDHHKTAYEYLVEMDLSFHYDVEESGASLAWKYFFPDTEPPMALKAVRDRDLWKFELEHTREINSAIFSYEYTFANWDKIMSDDFGYVMYTDGVAIERKHFKDLEELLKVTTRNMIIQGVTVPVANLPYTFVSDAAGKLSIGKPFAACYWDTPNGRTFGLRSQEGGMDVSEIAKYYGGGGHKHAAGFTVSYQMAQTLEVPGLI